MCGACLNAQQQAQGFTTLQLPKIPCDYSLQELKEMALVAEPPLLNFINSQIRVYSQNCNFFTKEINELLS